MRWSLHKESGRFSNLLSSVSSLWCWRAYRPKEKKPHLYKELGGFLHEHGTLCYTCNGLKSSLEQIYCGYNCKWRWQDYKKTAQTQKNPEIIGDKGRLPKWIPEPLFLADPSYRNKVVAKHLYNIKTTPKSRARIIARRMKENWGYMLAQNKYSKIHENLYRLHKLHWSIYSTTTHFVGVDALQNE